MWGTSTNQKQNPVSQNQIYFFNFHKSGTSHFFQLGFTQCNVDQPLRGLELQGKKEEKD